MRTPALTFLSSGHDHPTADFALAMSRLCTHLHGNSNSWTGLIPYELLAGRRAFAFRAWRAFADEIVTGRILDARRHRVRRKRLLWTGARTAPRRSGAGANTDRAGCPKARAQNALVHVVPGRVGRRPSTNPVAHASRAHSERSRRFQLFAAGRHAGALPPGQPSARDQPVFRNDLRSPAAGLQLHLPGCSGPRAGLGSGGFSPSLGGRRTFRRGILFAVLLDAARLDDARMGARRGPPRGLRVRSTQLLDELVLGRRSFRGGGLPRVRSAAAAAGARADSRCNAVGTWRWRADALTPL